MKEGVCEGREGRGVEGGDGREGVQRKTVIIYYLASYKLLGLKITSFEF